MGRERIGKKDEEWVYSKMENENENKTKVGGWYTMGLVYNGYSMVWE